MTRHDQPGNRPGKWRAQQRSEADVELRSQRAGDESEHHIAQQYGQHVYETLHDLLVFGDMADEVVSHGKDAYECELTLRLAAEAVAHKIGEAVARLTDKKARTDVELTFTADHPEIPWRAMKGMRNIVAHDYGGIDYEILWNALAEVVPQDMGRLRRILGA